MVGFSFGCQMKLDNRETAIGLNSQLSFLVEIGNIFMKCYVKNPLSNI